MSKKVLSMGFIMFGSIILVIVVLLLFLPLILSFLRLHPHYKKKSYNLTGKRALIITTSHGQLGGWGVAFDLGQSALLGEKLTRVAAEGKLIGAVCHGGLGLINIKDKNEKTS